MTKAQKNSIPCESIKLSIKFKANDLVEKLAPKSDDYGKVGVIKSKKVSRGEYHFCWVEWDNCGVWKPEHYNCIRKLKNEIKS